MLYVYKIKLSIINNIKINNIKIMLYHIGNNFHNIFLI